MKDSENLSVVLYFCNDCSSLPEIKEQTVATFETIVEREEIKAEKQASKNCFFIVLQLYIYPPDSHENDGGAIHRASIYPDLPRYCCTVVIFCFVFSFIEIRLKFAIAG